MLTVQCERFYDSCHGWHRTPERGASGPASRNHEKLPGGIVSGPYRSGGVRVGKVKLCGTRRVYEGPEVRVDTGSYKYSAGWNWS